MEKNIGKKYWKTCIILKREINGKNVEYFIRCPRCLKGVIVRVKDKAKENVSGWKGSFVPCNKCGLTGENSFLNFSITLKRKCRRCKKYFPRTSNKNGVKITICNDCRK